MKLLDADQLSKDIGIIQLFHSRLGLDLANAMAYHTGNFWYIDFLNIRNILIGNYLEILYSYEIVGDETANNAQNVLTMSDIESIIDHCYRELDKYNIV